VNARRVGDTARSPPARPLPHSRDSVSTTVQLCDADFAGRTCIMAPAYVLFYGLSHSVPVNVASRSTPGGETAGQQ